MQVINQIQEIIQNINSLVTSTKLLNLGEKKEKTKNKKKPRLKWCYWRLPPSM